MTTWATLWDYTFAAQAEYAAPWADPYDGVTAGTGVLASFPVAGTEWAGAGTHPIPWSLEAGSRAGMFADDFYHRIHVTPSVISMGNVIGTSQIPVAVWNGYFNDRAIENIALANLEGVTIISGETPPLAVHSLEEHVWLFNIASTGAAVIDGTITYDFDRGEVFVIPVTGKRVTAWAWPADWSYGVVERLQWATDIIESYDGSEQRRQLMLYPRRSLEFGFTATGTERKILESILWSWGGRVFAVPVWPDGEDLTAPISAGAYSVPSDAATRDYQADGLLIFMGDTSRDWEVCQIASVSPSAVTLSRPTMNAWPAGTRIYPARAARLQTEVALSHFDYDTSSGRAIFDMTDPHVVAADAGATTYRGLPVISMLANWVDTPEMAFERRMATFDNGTGVRFYEDEPERPATRQTLRYTFPDRAAAHAWRQLLHAMAGRFGSVWVRNHAEDLTMTSAMASNSTAMDVEWIGYTLYVGAAVGKKDVRIQLADGTVLYRRITAASELTLETERLTLDSAPGVDIQPADVVSISFVSLCRLDSDSVELAWWSGDVCESAVTFRGFLHDL